MDPHAPNQRPVPHAMARGSSPWGDGGTGGGEPEDERAAAPDRAGAADGDPPNPWLDQPADDRPRRSARIDDILRPRPGGGAALRTGWISLGIAALATAWLALTSVHMLQPSEKALVLTLGRHTGTLGPGLNLTLPWPLQRVIRGTVGTDRLTVVPDTDGEVLMPTRDGELIDVAFRVRWQVTDLRRFAFTLPDGEAAVRRLADAQVRAAVAELPFSATYDGDMRGQLQLRAAQRTQRVLDAWQAGVRIGDIELVRVAPPARLAGVFEKIGKARDDARRNRENDTAWREQELANARREAADFDRVYAQYQIAPDVTRTRIYYETLERILRANPVIVGAAGAPGAAPLPANTVGASPAPTEGR